LYKISIENLEFTTIIGVLQSERVKAQRVVVDADILYSRDQDYIDYAKVVEIIVDDIVQKKYSLIEDALDSLGKLLKKNYLNIKELEIKITKPDILQNCKVSVTKLIKF
jgi:dihydroneopterin aldolase